MTALSKLDPYKIRSQFFASLGDDVFKNLRPHMEPVLLKIGTVLFFHGDPVGFLYFPLDACVSIISTVRDGRGVEVALIGSEGMVGIWGGLGSESHWHQAIVQIPGDCVRIKARVFQEEVKRSNKLLGHLLRYTRYLIGQISQTAACNRLHRLDQRLARWLLIAHDQAKVDEFVETHEFLSQMLGSDRSEVTLAAGMLRKAGFISYARGRVKILDRRGLETICCDCYRVYAQEALRLRQGEN